MYRFKYLYTLVSCSNNRNSNEFSIFYFKFKFYPTLEKDSHGTYLIQYNSLKRVYLMIHKIYNRYHIVLL